MPAGLSRIKPQLSSLLPPLSPLLIPSLLAGKEREPPLSTTPGLNIWPGNPLWFLVSLMMPKRRGGSFSMDAAATWKKLSKANRSPQQQMGSETKGTFGTSGTKRPS